MISKVVTAATLILVAVGLGLAWEFWELNNGLLLILCAFAISTFAGIMVVVSRMAPFVALLSGPGLGALVGGALVMGLFLPHLAELGDRDLANYGSDETWQSLLQVQLFYSGGAGLIIGAFAGFLAGRHEAKKRLLR